jgi:uncharacterized damage-inducible protein DinB
MAIKDALLPEFDHEMAVTRRVLERAPLADADWKPHEKSMSLAALAAHIADIPSWVPLIMRQDHYDMSAGEGTPQATHASTADLLAAWDTRVAEARTHIDGASDAEMLQPWSLKSGGQAVMTLPRAAVLRNFLMNHTVHHRGQMSVYLRLRNVPVPSIYGPSADEK